MLRKLILSVILAAGILGAVTVGTSSAEAAGPRNRSVHSRVHKGSYKSVRAARARHRSAHVRRTHRHRTALARRAHRYHATVVHRRRR
jgi:hypothetical protein